MTRNLLIGIAIVAGLLGVAWLTGMHRMWTGPHQSMGAAGGGTALVKVVVPELSETAKSGKVIFDRNCAKCHGTNGAGVDKAGPPLIHVIYEPSHHGDGAFHNAARRGVRSHHWPFGNMPPIPDLKATDVARIIVYVREVQRANGIR